MDWLVALWIFVGFLGGYYVVGPAAEQFFNWIKEKWNGC